MSFLHRFLVFVFALASAFALKASFPIVRNFPRNLHNGGPQTWAISEDSLGRMYFGNTNGLLIYDSSHWSLHGVDYGSTVRSLLHNDNFGHRLYAGASDEFGFFQYQSDGIPVYHTLTGLLPPNIKGFGEIWNIFTANATGDIIFQSDYYIFDYDGASVRYIQSPSRISTSASIGDKIYVALSRGNIAELSHGRLRDLDCSAFPRYARVIEILPYLNRCMIVTEFDGLYTIEHDAVVKLQLDFADYLLDKQIFCAGCRGNYYAFGTVSHGVVAVNIDTGRLTFSNVSSGMQNNTVLSLHFDSECKLWLGLDNGIDMIQVDAPYYSLLGRASVYGAGYVSHLSGSILYLGTNQGLYAMNYTTDPQAEPQKLNQLVKGQIWSITQVGDDVIVSSDGGVLIGRGYNFRYVPDVPGTWCVRQLRRHPQYALASTYEGFYLLRHAEGQWLNTGVVSGFSDAGGRFEEDDNGDLWISHWLKGVYRLRIDPEHRSFANTEFFDHSNGLPSNHNVSVSIVSGEPLVVTDGGFSRYDSHSHRIITDRKLTDLFGSLKSPVIHEAPSGDLWCLANRKIILASADDSGRQLIDSISYSALGSELIPGFEHFNFISRDQLIVSALDGFYDIRLGAQISRPEGRNVFIRAIHAYGDSTINIGCGMQAPRSIQLPYASNSIRVDAVAPEYRIPGAVTYSFFLENYDNDWSSYGPSASKEYTHLPEGEYIIHVKAFNAFTRQTFQTTMQLTLLPPWYRSLPAKIVYIVLVVILLVCAYLSVRNMAHKASRKVAANKERELNDMRRQARENALIKDYEIETLKSRQLENDIQHKTKELSNITMNVVRKNEILLDISDRLSKLNEPNQGADISRQIAKIQTLIKQNITRDDDWRNFVRTFDAAYGNFSKHLQVLHPGLTPTELRVCCYLIMGLNSKEIAQLSNISYRSVEMTRYRLRKKLELTRDVALTDYLKTVMQECEESRTTQNNT